MYVLHHADQPQIYNDLPADPHISPMVGLWKGAAKPIALALMLLTALAGFFHYIRVGRNETDESDEQAAALATAPMACSPSCSWLWCGPSATAVITTDVARAVLPAVHALSRGTAVALMGLLPPASDDGLGASSVRSLATADAAVGTAIAAVIAALLVGAWVPPVTAAVALVGAGMGAYARRTLGGIAGDLLGATQQLTDLAALVLLVGVIRHGASVPWWA